jgi:predicted ester cyclase
MPENDDSAAMIEPNKTLVRRSFEEVMNKGELGIMDEIFGPDVLFQASPLPETRGREAYKQVVTAIRSAFPDIHYTVELLVAEGDTVVARWRTTATQQGEFLGIAPTGKPGATSGTDTCRISGGKIVEMVCHWDALGLLQRLGSVSGVGKAAVA